MKQSEIKELPNKELHDKVSQMEANYFEMKINHAVTPLENPMQLKSLRRAIARIKTEITKRGGAL